MTRPPASLSHPCRIVRSATRDGHPIHGALFEPECEADRKVVVLHSHGTLGNFYFNPFIDEFAKSYCENGISFLSFNHQTHDAIAESEINGRLEYIGGSISEFPSCLDDFEAMRNLLAEIGYEHFVLQGHSLGCERVLFDRRNAAKSWPIILLAPVNSYETQRAWCAERLGLTIDELTKAILTNPSGTLRYDIYGSPSLDLEWDYCIPIYEKAYLSFVQSEAFSYFSPERTVLKSIDNALVIFSKNDAFHSFYDGDLQDFFAAVLGKGSDILALDCNHDFQGKLRIVCDACVDFIKKRTDAFD